MFKPKHQFTCPDVIYLRNAQKRNTKIALSIYVILFGGMAAVGHFAERKAIKELQQDAETLANQD